MAGFGSPLLPLGLASSAAPAPADSGYRSFLAFWAGGSANAGAAPVVTSTPETTPGGGKRRAVYARYFPAETYEEKKDRLLRKAAREQRAEVEKLLTVRENAVVEAALAREQKQDYFLFEALKTLHRAEEQLRALHIEPPALASKELDMAFVMMIMAADE